MSPAARRGPAGDTPAAIRARALRLLAGREHTRAELERKLIAQLERAAVRRVAEDGDGDGDSDSAAAADRGVDRERLGSSVAAVLDALQAHGLLDDTRAAEAIVRTHAGRMGDRALRQRLLAKGVDAGGVASALGGVPDDELGRARRLWERRYGAPAADAAERARQARFLLGRGFSAETVQKVLRGRD